MFLCKLYQRVPSFVIVAILALSTQANAALEEVTFQAPQLVDLSQPIPPLGPVSVGSLSGYFFFDTSQLTGGLRPVFEVPGVPPGGPGTVSAFFGAGPSGAATINFNDGSVLTVPLTSGFSLDGDYSAMICGIFDECSYSLGQVLTLNQFNAAPDPWLLVTNGMTGSFDQFFPDVFGPLQGDGRFEVSSVPEPATLWLLGLGLASVGFTRRRKDGDRFQRKEYSTKTGARLQGPWEL